MKLIFSAANSIGDDIDVFLSEENADDNVNEYIHFESKEFFFSVKESELEKAIQTLKFMNKKKYEGR